MSLPPFHWWRTVFFLIPVIAIYTIVLGTLSLVAGLIDRRGNLAHRCAQLWARFIVVTSGVRIQPSGRPLPPAGASAVFVANHESFFDVPIVFSALPRQLRIMAKSSLIYVPFIGWHLYRSGHVLVDRHRPGASIFKRMRRMARSGASLIVFPEAGRNDGVLLTFKAGIFLLAIEHGLPIVPITILGSREVMPRGRLRVEPGVVGVVVHDAVPTSGLARGDARSLAARVEAIVQSALPS